MPSRGTTSASLAPDRIGLIALQVQVTAIVAFPFVSAVVTSWPCPSAVRFGLSWWILFQTGSMLFGAFFVGSIPIDFASGNAVLQNVWSSTIERLYLGLKRSAHLVISLGFTLSVLTTSETVTEYGFVKLK